MEPSLPPGYAARRPRADELNAVVDLIAAADVANIGEPDVDADDVRNDWEADDFDVEQDARVAVADGGELAAYAFSRTGYAFAIVHPAHRGRGLGTALLPFVEARTAAQGNTRIKQQVDGDNEAARDLLTRHGYAATQHYWRMRVDLGPDATLEDPDWPDAIRVRTYDAEADDPAAHALINEVFVEVEGFVPRDLETWRTESTGRLQFHPELSWVIGREGRMVGLVTCEAWETEGYVGLLAVARDHRGLGLGRALLLAAFRSFRDAGLPSASLSVHARNEAGKRLYESVGMTVAWRAERWEKALDG